MGHLCDDQRPATDDGDELRRRVAELERANKRLTERLRARSDPSDHDLLENLGDIIYTTDGAGTLLSVNRAVKEVLGFDPGELIGTHYGRWIHPGDREKAEAARAKARQGGRTTHRIVIPDKQGAEHHVEISVGPLVIEGRIEGTQGIIRDVTAQHRAERQIRESEEKLRALFNAATESILLVDYHGTILTMNDIAAKRLGHAVAEMVGRRPTDVTPSLMPWDVAERREALIRQVFETGTAVHFEDQRADICFANSMYPVFGGDGKVTSVAIFSQDVTKQRKAQEDARKFKAVFDKAAYGAAITTCSGYLLYVNEAFARMHGYESAELAGRHLSICHSQDQLPRVNHLDERLSAEGSYVEEEVWHVRKDGTAFPTLTNGMVIPDDQGRPLFRAGMAIDITERKQLERKLRESEERYRTVVETAEETIAVVDAQGVFQFMNTTAAGRLGGQPADFIGQTMWDLFPREVADVQVAHIRAVIESGRGQNAIALTNVRGQLRWYNTTVEPLRDAAGHILAGLVIARDIHELRTAQQELEAYREKMIHAEHLASLGTLSAMLSHEMTQPLTVLRLSLQNALTTLEEVSPPATVLDDLQDALAEIGQVAAIVQRFRDFARRTSDEVVGEVSLAAAAGKVVRLLEESAREARITLEARQLEELPPIRACGRDIEQVFFALMQNAIHASDGSRDHCLRISGAQRDGFLELQFVDDCGGIPPEILEHVFEPFVTTKPAGQGTGLGLCVAERIVSRAGGLLRVDSQWGKGTTFFLSWPMSRRQPKESMEDGEISWTV